jgi:hypothetical protein
LCAQLPQAGAHRPAAVPEEYVITPFGYSHPSCVIQLAKRDTVVKDGPAIQHSDGTLDNIPACNYTHFTARGEVVAAGAAEKPTIGHSWIENYNVTTSTSYGGIVQTWSVPPNPRSNDGQTLFFFPGLEDINDVVTILQPVLGWNAFSNFRGWSIASWNCCYNGVSLYSSPMGVSAGDFISGEVFSNCNSGTLTCPTWFVMTEDTEGGMTTLNSTSNYGQTFNWAFGIALEVYNVVQCSDYPPNGSLTFYGALYDINFDPIDAPSWRIGYGATGLGSSPSGLSPQCNYGGQVLGGLTLNY